MGKKKNHQNEEEMENYFDVFMRNYRNVPGFRSVVKLVGYFIFILIFMVVVMLANGDKDIEENDNTTSTTTTKVVEENQTYKEILDGLVNKEMLSYEVNITINEEIYLITATSELGEIYGYFETDESTKRFKISNSKIYELKLDNSIENMNLFGNIELDFIIPANLVNILKNNLSTKRITDEYSIYTYKLDYRNIENKINVYVTKENITKIEINNNEYNYIINYK